MISIQIASDLHIEYKNDSVPNPLEFITPSAEVLLLCGDIGSFYKIEQLTEFLKILCSYFQVVLYVPGNHEWYTVNGYETLGLEILEERMYKLERSITNLTILNQTSVIIQGICFAGCTLWSRPERKIPSFIVRIPDLRTKEYQDRHEDDLIYLKKMMIFCQKNNYKLVVATHYPPSKKVLEGICAKKKKYEFLYATDLEYLLDKTFVQTWICGHVHKNFDFISVGGCRVVGNQKGKLKDKITDYSKKFLIKI